MIRFLSSNQILKERQIALSDKKNQQKTVNDLHFLKFVFRFFSGFKSLLIQFSQTGLVLSEKKDNYKTLQSYMFFFFETQFFWPS